MKRGRLKGIDEVRVEMLVMAERVGVRWTKRLIKHLHKRGECMSIVCVILIRLCNN